MKRMPQRGLRVDLPAIRSEIVGVEPRFDWVEANDNRRPTENPGFARLRAQAAIVRCLADCIARIPGRADTNGLRTQLIEEMARLGCLLLEGAASLTRERPRFR